MVLPRSPQRLASCPAPAETFVKKKGIASSTVQLFSGAWIPTLIANYQASHLLRDSYVSPSHRKVRKLEPIDILFGRGNTINQHRGNTLMRQIATMNKEEYKRLFRERKQMAADALLGFMEKCGSRFLEVDPTSPKCRPTYRTVDYRRVVEKWMQFLREIPVKEKRQRQVVEIADKHRDHLAAAKSLVGFQQMLPKSPRPVPKAQHTTPNAKHARTTSHASKTPKNKVRGIHFRGADSIVGCSRSVGSIVDTAGIHLKNKKKHGLPLKKRILSRSLPMQDKVVVGGGHRGVSPNTNPPVSTPPMTTHWGSQSFQHNKSKHQEGV
eukprot:scaffold7349_cov173-Amphora_coffeaeformis.AAC.3